MEKLSDELTSLQFSAKTNVVAQILHAAKYDDDLDAGRSLRADFSFGQSQEYLLLMTRNDLLRYDRPSGSYKVTRKGEAFLKTYRQTQEFIRLIDEELGL